MMTWRLQAQPTLENLRRLRTYLDMNNLRGPHQVILSPEDFARLRYEIRGQVGYGDPLGNMPMIDGEGVLYGMDIRQEVPVDLRRLEGTRIPTARLTAEAVPTTTGNMWARQRDWYQNLVTNGRQAEQVYADVRAFNSQAFGPQGVMARRPTPMNSHRSWTEQP